MIGGAEEERYLDQVIEAKRKGYKFIKVILHHERIQRGQKEILISGCVGLQAIKVGSDGIGGLPEYEFKLTQSDEMRFVFDKNEREYVCQLLDDKGPGYFSEISFNRDLLASHFTQNYFIIDDPEVKKDVEKRYNYLLSLNGKKVTRKAAPVLDNNATEEEIDEQIRFLKEKKKSIKKEVSDVVKEEEEKISESTTEIKLTPKEIKQIKKIEANKLRVAKQKEKRRLESQMRKAEAEAKKELPAEVEVKEMELVGQYNTNDRLSEVTS